VELFGFRSVRGLSAPYRLLSILSPLIITVLSWLFQRALFFHLSATAMRPQCPTSKRKTTRTTISHYRTSVSLARVYGGNGYLLCGHLSTSSVR
jgi:hypothetical protein